MTTTLAITHQRICTFRNTCPYPTTKSHLFLRHNQPCTNGYQCTVEATVESGHLIAMIEDADQVERNVKRFLLPWDCGCRRCQLGYNELCYAKRGPSRELRTVFRQRWWLNEVRQARLNARKRKA